MLLNAFPIPSQPIAIPDKDSDYAAAKNLLALADNSLSRTPDSSRADSPVGSEPDSLSDLSLPLPPSPTQAPHVRTRTLPHRVKVKQELGAYAWRDLSASPDYSGEYGSPMNQRVVLREDSTDDLSSSRVAEAHLSSHSYGSPYQDQRHSLSHFSHSVHPDHHMRQHEHSYDPMSTDDHHHALAMMTLMAGDHSPSPPPAPASACLALDSSSTPQPQKRRHFPKDVVRELIAWLHEHKACPFPDRKTKLEMIEQYQLSETQLENWFVNGRRRYLSKTRTPTGQIVYVVRMPGKKGPKPKHPSTPTPPSSNASSPCFGFTNAVAQMRIGD